MSSVKAFVDASWPHDLVDLPTWYTRPSREATRQASLFALEPDQLKDVLATLCISVDDLARWRQRRWVSFDLEIGNRIEQWHINELRFVRDVVRSGLSDANIESMLAELPRPMDFDPAQVAYSFSFGWVQAIPPGVPDVSEFIEAHLDEWLAELAEVDPDRLIALRNVIDEVIGSRTKGDREGGPEGDMPEAAK